MLPRTHLIRIQRTMYDKLRDHASHMLGGLSPELKLYFREYQRDFQTYKELSTKRELLLALLNSQIVYCGDYHTLPQAQRTVIRLFRDAMRVLKRKKRRVVFALEMLSPEHNDVTQRYLSGKLKEKEFLRQISFQANWGFAWENYRGLFEFAKEHGIEVVGINPIVNKKKATLKERDQFAAQVIAGESTASLETLVIVIVGDLHLAGRHLPAEVSQILFARACTRNTLTIHQNNEKLYWQLVDQGLEQFVDVVKVKEGVFCVMNTPPWIKLQSHVKWAELVAESGRVPHLEAPAAAFDEIDYTHEAQELLTVIAHFVGLPLPKMDNFEIYGPLDVELLDTLLGKKTFSKAQIILLKSYAQEFKSQFIPKENILFLNSLSLNHISSQAGLYLHAVLSGFDGIFESPNLDFYPFIWIEALGFFASKIINPKRKCSGHLDLKTHLSGRAPKSHDDNFLAAELALWHLEAEIITSDRSSSVHALFRVFLPGPSDKNVLYYKTAKILGHLLGNALYQALVDTRIEAESIRALFFKRFLPSSEARELYLQWIHKLDQYGYRESVKKDRL